MHPSPPETHHRGLAIGGAHSVGLCDALHTLQCRCGGINASVALMTSAETLGDPEMRTILLVSCLIAFAAPAHAAQKPSLAKDCRALVGKEEPKAQTGKATWGNSTCNASAIA